MNYQLRMFYADALNHTAGSKATKDCSDILAELGFQNFDIPIYSDKGNLGNVLRMAKLFSVLFAKLNKNDIIVLQYPLLGVNKWLKFIVGILGIKGCKKVCLIHDLDSLRQVHHAWTLEEEVERLNAFDVIIVHNDSMKKLLLEHGVYKKMLCLELFDYLIPLNLNNTIINKQQSDPIIPSNRNTVVFAGNLGKSIFVDDLNQLKGICINLYGPGYKEKDTAEYIKWFGSFDANELPAKLNGDFGLIWDGDEITSCSGNLGNYMKYNNPHKASLYLLSELPIIAPTNTAIGAFIEKNKIGITINSLLDLPDLLQAITESDYQTMKTNVKMYSKLIASGSFLKKQMNSL